MTAEENIIDFMVDEMLPDGYELASSLKKKLLQIAKDGILEHNDYSRNFNEEAKGNPTWAVEFCIDEIPETAAGWIALGLIDSDLNEEEKLRFVKATLSKYLIDETGFTYPKELPYHRLAGFVIKREGFDKKYLQYLLVKDVLSSIEEISGNFTTIFNSDMLSDQEKILCLIGADRVTERRGDAARLLTEVAKAFLESDVSLLAKLEVAELFVENKFRDYAKNRSNLMLVENLKGAGQLKDIPLEHTIDASEEIKNAFGTGPHILSWYNGGGAIRYACRWYVSVLNEKERERFVMRTMASSNPTRDKNVITGVCDALYYGGYDSEFSRRVLEQGLKLSSGIVRSLCYEYLFLLYDSVNGYVKKSLHDTDMKVRNTFARVALSPSRLKEMDHAKKVQLIELVDKNDVELNKRQSTRFAKLKEELEQ